MNVMRTLWASIQGDPVFMRRVNGWLTVFWIVMIPVPCHRLDLLGDLRRGAVAVGARLGPLVGVAGRPRRSQPGRGGEAAEEEPVEQRVVEKLVEETTVELAAGK